MFGFLKKLIGTKETPTPAPVSNPAEPYCMGPESAGYLNALRTLQQLDPENPMLQTPIALAVLAKNPTLSPAPKAPKVSISVPAPVPAPTPKQDNIAAPARPALAPKVSAAKNAGPQPSPLQTSPLQPSPLSITATKLSEETPVELMDDAELLSAFNALSTAIESGQHEVTRNIVFTPLTTPIDDDELDESEWG